MNVVVSKHLVAKQTSFIRFEVKRVLATHAKTNMFKYLSKLVPTVWVTVGVDCISLVFVLPSSTEQCSEVSMNLLASSAIHTMNDNRVRWCSGLFHRMYSGAGLRPWYHHYPFEIQIP